MFYVVKLVIAGCEVYSARTFACVGEAVQWWRDNGRPASDTPDWACVEKCDYKHGDGTGMMRRVTGPLAYTVD